MSFDLTITNEFAVSRTSKSGKTTYRGALGVITSGDARERARLADRAIETLIANNNYRHLMREVERVFPASFIKKSKEHVSFVKGKEGAPDQLWFVTSSADGAKRELELYEGYTKANKATAHKYAKAVIAIVESLDFDSSKIKGEKAIYLDALIGMVEREQARLAETTEA